MFDDSEDEVLERVAAIFNKRKSLFSFGTTGERKTFTEQTIPTRLGIMFPSNNKSPHLGPGTYNNENEIPGPGDYQKDISKPTPIKQNRYPFNQKCPRILQENLVGKDAPSVGTYNWFVKVNQSGWQRDTNLKPINIPKITFQSTICANTDKLQTSHEERNYQRRLRCFERYFKDPVN